MFTLHCSALPSAARVVAFQGHEAISQLYSFAIGLVVPHGETIALDDTIGCRATLTLSTEQGPQRYHGVIAALDMVHAWQDHSLYRLTLRPELAELALTRHSAVWVDIDLPQLCNALIDEQAELLPADYAQYALSESYAPRQHVCQYQESHLHFLSRQLERSGAYYYFSHDGDALQPEKLIITDHVGSHQPSRSEAVRYVPLTGDAALSGEAMDGWVMRGGAQPRDVTTNDFDYLHPALQVSGGPVDVSHDGGGAHIYHGDDVRTPDDAKRQSTLRAEAMVAARVRFTGNGRVYHIRAGHTFELTEHPHDNMNARYLAVEVMHYGNDGADAATLAHLQFSPLPQNSTYRCAVTAIAADVQYRHPRTTLTPRIDGVERAFVDGPADSDYAQIDEHGRYKVAIHFDERWRDADDGQGNCSTWVRMLQPHGGIEEGFHFPLRKGTEVMVSFVGGDPDRPVIIGVAPNALQPSPVRKANHTQNVVQTGGKNRIEMGDEEGKQYIDISTPPKKTWIHLGEPHDKHGAYLFFKTDGNQCINIGSTRDIEVGDSLSEHVKGHVDWKHDSGRKDVVAGGVEERYSGQHRTVVDGMRTHVVDGLVSENYKVLSTLVDGDVEEKFGSQSTQVRGGQKTTVNGSHELVAGTSSVSIAGTTSVNMGATGGMVTSLNLDIPGGVNITTPTWKVVNPNESWVVATYDMKAAFKASTFAVEMKVGGIKAEHVEVSVASVGIKIRRNGLKDDFSSVTLKRGGLEFESYSVMVHQAAAIILG